MTETKQPIHHELDLVTHQAQDTKQAVEATEIPELKIELKDLEQALEHLAAEIEKDATESSESNFPKNESFKEKFKKTMEGLKSKENSLHIKSLVANGIVLLALLTPAAAESFQKTIELKSGMLLNAESLVVIVIFITLLSIHQGVSIMKNLQLLSKGFKEETNDEAVFSPLRRPEEKSRELNALKTALQKLHDKAQRQN
jgi:hypothetical protein